MRFILKTSKPNTRIAWVSGLMDLTIHNRLREQAQRLVDQMSTCTDHQRARLQRKLESILKVDSLSTVN
jgi:uncharacterized membrane protein YgcG